MAVGGELIIRSSGTLQWLNLNLELLNNSISDLDKHSRSQTFWITEFLNLKF